MLSAPTSFYATLDLSVAFILQCFLSDIFKWMFYVASLCFWERWDGLSEVKFIWYLKRPENQQPGTLRPVTRLNKMFTGFCMRHQAKGPEWKLPSWTTGFHFSFSDRHSLPGWSDWQQVLFWIIASIHKRWVMKSYKKCLWIKAHLWRNVSGISVSTPAAKRFCTWSRKYWGLPFSFS